MTEQEIQKLKVGRELDVLIHFKVFGIKSENHGYDTWLYRDARESITGYSSVPWYSLNMSSAWLIVDKFVDLVAFDVCSLSKDRTIVRLNSHDRVKDLSVFAESKSAAHAICLAAIYLISATTNS